MTGGRKKLLGALAAVMILAIAAGAGAALIARRADTERGKVDDFWAAEETGGALSLDWEPPCGDLKNAENCASVEEASLKIGGDEKHGALADVWAAAQAADAATVTLLRDVEISATLTMEEGDVTLDLNGKMLKMTGAGSVLAVAGGSLTLRDGAPEAGSHEVRGGASDVTIAGGVITGGNRANGGGIEVSGGSFTLAGGTVAGNTASKAGGGVYAAGGKVTVTGGTVSHNRAARGGGVEVGSGAFEMTGGAVQNNAAEQGADVDVQGDAGEPVSLAWGGGEMGTVCLGAGAWISVRSPVNAPREKIVIEAPIGDVPSKVLAWEEGTADPTAYFSSADAGACFYAEGAAAFIGKHSVVQAEPPTWVGHTRAEFRLECGHGCGKEALVALEGERIEETFSAATCTRAGHTAYRAEVRLSDLDGFDPRDTQFAETVSAETMSEAGASPQGHTWEYAAEGAVLTATCTNPAHREEADGAKIITATLTEPAAATYTGEDIEASVKVEGGEFPGGYYIDYEYKRDANSKYAETWSYAAPGYYRATLTAAGDRAAKRAAATLEYIIERAPLRLKIQGATVEYGDADPQATISYVDGLLGYDAEMIDGKKFDEALKKAVTFRFGGYEAGAARRKTFEVTATVDAGALAKRGVNIDLENYKFLVEGCRLEIAPRKITVTLAFASMTYGDEPDGGWVRAEAVRDGLGTWYAATDGDDISILRLSFLLRELGGAPSAMTPAGTYTVVPDWDNENYAVEFADEQYGHDFKFTVLTKKIEEITWSGAGAYTYCGAAQAFPTATAEGAVLEVGIKEYRGRGDGALFRDAGTYVFTAKLSAADAKNCELTASNLDFSVTVSPKALRAIWTVQNYEYSGAALAFPAATAATGIEGEGEFALQVTVQAHPAWGGDGEFLVAGDYTFWAALGADVYNYTLKAETAKREVTVAKKKVAVAWGNETYTYRGEIIPAAEYPTAKAGGIALEVSLVGDIAFRDAGTYTFTAALSEADGHNYELTGSTHAYGIGRATLPVQWSGSGSGYTFVYGEAAEPAARADGLGEDGEIRLQVTMLSPAAGAFANVGKYTFRAAFDAADGNYEALVNNYDLAGAEREYEIVRASLAAKLTAGVCFGDAIGEENVTVTVDVHGLKNGDDSEKIGAAAYAAAKGFFRFGGYEAGVTGVGTAKKKVSVQNSIENAGRRNYVLLENYTVTFEEGEIIVSRRKIRIVLAGDLFNTYGDEVRGAFTAGAVRDGKPQEKWFGGAADEGLLQGALAFAFQGATGGAREYYPRMAAGEYTVVARWAEGSALAENYEIVGCDGAEYTVRRRPLAVNVLAEVIYGDALGGENVTLTVGSGLVSGDDAEGILAEAKGAAHFDYGGYRAGVTGVGDPIRVTAADADITNYAVQYVSAAGNLTVSPRKIIVYIGGRLQHVYGDTPVRPAFHADGKALPTLQAVRTDGAGDWFGNVADEEALERGAVYTLEREERRALDAGAPAGGYTLTLTWENKNYQVTAEGVSYNVEKADLTVALEAHVTYGEEIGAQNVTVTVADIHALKNGDGKQAVEEAARRAAVFDFGGYRAGTPVANTGIKVRAAGTLPNYNVTYAECPLIIGAREISVRLAGEASGEYTGHGQGVSVRFVGLYEGDEGEFLLGRDYKISYTADGAAGSFEGALPLTAGGYFAEIGLTMSEVAANYALTGERSFAYEILPAAIEERFTKGFEKFRSALYSADDGAALPLELPAQGTAAFPLVLRGNDGEIVNRVALRYIVLTHAEDGAAHEALNGKIEGFLASLRAGATALEGVEYAAHVPPVREPGGYCVFFEATAPNHAAYYGYFTLHIYRERLTVKMEEGGLTLTGEYGDTYTYGALFDLVFGHIESITATAADGSLSANKKDEFGAQRECFRFYFTDAAGTEYAAGDVLPANKIYTLNVRYFKAGAEGAENFIEFVWEGGNAPTMEVAPRALVLTLGGSRVHQYGAETLGTIEATAACKQTPNGGVNAEGLIGGDTVEGLHLAFTLARGERTGLPLGRELEVGAYSIEVECGNGNYTVEEVAGATYTVTPGELIAEVTAEVVYGDALGRDNVTVNIVGGLAPWDDGAALAEEIFGAGNFLFEGYTRGGTHTGEKGAKVRAERLSVGNYIVIFTAGEVTVKPRSIRVRLSGGTNVYGAERHGEISATAVRADGAGREIVGDTWYGNEGDALDFTYRFRAAGGEAAEYTRTMGAGKYTLVIVWENADYVIVATDGAEHYTVTPATLTYPVPAGGQYSGAARDLMETLTGVADETLHRGADYDVFYNGAKYDGLTQSILPRNVGEYTVRIALTGEAERNYVLAAESFLYTIARRELERPAGGDLTVDYDGAAHELTVNGFDEKTMQVSGDHVDPASARVTATAVGRYTVTIKLRDLANYCWVGGAQEALSFTLTISAVEIAENEKFDALRYREYLYDPSGATLDLALPAVGSDAFPFTVPGGGAAEIFYLVEEHKEGAHDEAAIEARLEELKGGRAAGWHTADATMRVNAPMGYCVYFLIQSDNHKPYYGYYSVHIYREEITVYLDESVADGHFPDVEYGDAAHTQAALREGLCGHIQEAVAGAAPDAGSTLGTKSLGARLDGRYFQFYLIDEAGNEYAFGDADGGDRLPVGTYKIGVRYLLNGEESDYVRFRWHGAQPDFKIVPRRIELSVSFEGHTYGETPKALSEQATLTAVRADGAEGTWYGKRGETLGGLGLVFSLRSRGELLLGSHMDAGEYDVQVSWSNQNYEILPVSLQYTVRPRILTADFGAFDGLVYGGENAPAVRIVSGIFERDEVGLILSYAGTANDGTPYAGSELPTRAGDYTVAVQLAGGQSKNYALNISAHPFTIARAVYDMSGVRFESGTFREDGTPHGLAATGLPAGVTAQYAGNGQTEPGVYEVVAQFLGDYNNYEEIPARTATLTVLRTRLQSSFEGANTRSALPDAVVESEEGLDPAVELRLREGGQETERAVTESAAFGGGLAGIYEMRLVQDGAEVEAAGAFTVRLRIPESLRGREFTVLAVRGAGAAAEVTAIDYTVEGDYIVVTLNGFSALAFTYPKTSLGMPIGLAALALALGVAALAFELKSIRKRRKKA